MTRRMKRSSTHFFFAFLFRLIRDWLSSSTDNLPSPIPRRRIKLQPWRPRNNLPPFNTPRHYNSGRRANVQQVCRHSLHRAAVIVVIEYSWDNISIGNSNGVSSAHYIFVHLMETLSLGLFENFASFLVWPFWFVVEWVLRALSLLKSYYTPYRESLLFAINVIWPLREGWTVLMDDCANKYTAASECSSSRPRPFRL